MPTTHLDLINGKHQEFLFFGGASSASVQSEIEAWLAAGNTLEKLIDDPTFDDVTVGDLTVSGALVHAGETLGFYDVEAVAQPEVTGARDETEGAMVSLLAALELLGLIVDSTTAS